MITFTVFRAAVLLIAILLAFFPTLRDVSWMEPSETLERDLMLKAPTRFPEAAAFLIITI